MNADIRSYFKKVPKKDSFAEKQTPKKDERKKRRRLICLDSDDGDDDLDVSVISVKTKKTESRIHNSEVFAKTLAQTVTAPTKKTGKSKSAKEKKEPKLVEIMSDQEAEVVSKKIKTPDIEKPKSRKRSVSKVSNIEPDNKPNKTLKEKIKKDTDKSKNTKRKHEPKVSDSESSNELDISPKKKKVKVVDIMDFDAEEKLKRRKNVFLSYLNRSGPENPGSKEVPDGAEGCFEGLTFLKTGVLDSLTFEEVRDIVQKYGGRILSSVTKNLKYLIVGKDPGPAKMEKAQQLNTKIISEDEFLNLITTLSAPLLKSGAKKITAENLFPTKIEESTTVDKETDLEPSLSKTELKKRDSMLSWSDKYSPKSMKEIIGQFGENSLANRLFKWLRDWHSDFKFNGKKGRLTYYNRNDDGSALKAALLSGPPGIGKTTTAHIVAKELGFQVFEFNASDTRNKTLLKQEVSGLIEPNSLITSVGGDSSKCVLVMDEVDGMSGNEDRGGIQELLELIKASKMPIICICNDRQHPKLRTLAYYCLDLRFPKPRLDQIKGAMMSICFKEKIQMKPDLLTQIIIATNNDIRQTINYLSMLSCGGRKTIESVPTSNMGDKPLLNNPWEITKKILIKSEHCKMNYDQKSELFFTDYSAIPLFVQENYVKIVPDAPKNQILSKMAKTAESLSMGDLIDKQIRSSNSWELLTSQAFFSCVMPSYLIGGHASDVIAFPSWFGKNSKQTKFKRLISELHSRFRYTSATDAFGLISDTLHLFRIKFLLQLKKGTGGVASAVQMMHDYYLLREDLDSILELSQWPNSQLKYEDINSKVKASFTRNFNDNKIPLPYSITKNVSAKKTKSTEMDYLEGNGDEDVISDNEDNEDLEDDTMIKVKKSSGKKKSKK